MTVGALIVGISIVWLTDGVWVDCNVSDEAIDGVAVLEDGTGDNGGEEPRRGGL
jgi:hypothetical protein